MDQPNMIEDARLQELYARRMAARGDGGGTSCVTPEAILALVQREGTEEERLVTLDHVMACAACHREYEWLMAVDQAGLEAEGASAAGQRRVWWRGTPLALAASLAAVVGAAVVLSTVLHPGAELTRGAESDIVLIAPGVQAAAGRPITFTWRALPGVSRYVLEVQRPDGSIALADTTADTVVVVSDVARRLPDSAYRWWVREVTGGAEPRSSAFRDLRLTGG
jgi:hypothetical protein